jgi:hypothetical protein
MRGSTEDVMLCRHAATPEEEARARDEAVAEGKRQGVPDRIVWDEVSSVAEAMDHWEQEMLRSQCDNTLAMWKHQVNFTTGEAPMKEGARFEDFVQLATTTDGVRNWTVEEDMTLSELISKTAVREGVTICYSRN